MSKYKSEFSMKSWSVRHKKRNVVYHLRTDPLRAFIGDYRLTMVDEDRTNEFIYNESELILLRDLLNYAFPEDK